jgi:hypothetical protein
MTILMKQRGYKRQANGVYRTLVRRIGCCPDSARHTELASPEAVCTCIAVHYLNCAAINAKVDGSACRCTLNGSTRLVHSA